MAFGITATVERILAFIRRRAKSAGEGAARDVEIVVVFVDDGEILYAAGECAFAWITVEIRYEIAFKRGVTTSPMTITRHGKIPSSAVLPNGVLLIPISKYSRLRGMCRSTAFRMWRHSPQQRPITLTTVGHELPAPRRIRN